MPYSTLFTRGAAYRLPDGTPLRADYDPPREGWPDGCWRFYYMPSDELALEVFSDGMITQADQKYSTDMGRMSISSTRITRSDLTVEDIQPY